jgi:hypothetical protein
MIAKKHIVVLGMVLVLFLGCSFEASKKGAFMKNYDKALKETDPQKIASLRHGSEDEKKAIEKFNEFYRAFSEGKIRKSLKYLYGEKAYLHDGFREVQGIDNIEKYFISSTQAFHECTFDIQDVAVSEGNYYFRWIMKLVLKGTRMIGFKP